MEDEASLIPGVRDFYLLSVMPIAAYWLSASIFHLFDSQRWFQDYKIHPYEAGPARNRATLRQVFRQVISQQVIQVVFSLLVDGALASNPSPGLDTAKDHELSFAPKNSTTWTQQPHTPFPTGSLKNDFSAVTLAVFSSAGAKLAFQLAVAVIVADFWQYASHRIFHSNKFLYKHVHSVHHRIYVPYSYGALYNTLLEAFIADTIGMTVTLYVSGLPTLPATWFATVSIIKAVNDHSGYAFPYNPFNYISSNTTEFHDIHHQNWGTKHNFSQVYLTIWDDLLGTTMPAKEVAARRERVKASESAALNAATSVKKIE